MGRKNKRVEASIDSNFDKFVKSINNNKISYSKPQQKINIKPIEEIKVQTREERNASRLEFAEEMLKKAGAEYKVIDRETGNILIKRKSDGATFQFYAPTGIITGYREIRGIHSIIKLVTEKIGE